MCVCMSCVYALCVSLTCMPYVYALCVCLMCMPYMYALSVCLECTRYVYIGLRLQVQVPFHELMTSSHSTN